MVKKIFEVVSVVIVTVATIVVACFAALSTSAYSCPESCWNVTGPGAGGAGDIFVLVYAFFILASFVSIIVAILCSIYWVRKSNTWKLDGLAPRIFAGIGFIASTISAVMILAGTIFFLHSQSVTENQAEDAASTTSAYVKSQVLTPSKTEFVCQDQVAIGIDSSGVVQEYIFSGEGVEQTTTLGTVDAKTRTFTWENFGYIQNDTTRLLISGYEDELQHCKNVDDDTVFGLYEEIPSTGFYQ